MKLLALALAFALLTPTLSLAADGAAVYAGKCQSCHGADGAGDTPVGKAMNIPSIKGTGTSAEAVIEAIGAHQGEVTVEAPLSHAGFALPSSVVAKKSPAPKCRPWRFALTPVPGGLMAGFSLSLGGV